MHQSDPDASSDHTTSGPDGTGADRDPDAGRDLVAYAAGTAGVAEQRATESHLAVCETCAATVADLRVTLLMLEITRLDDGVED